MLPKLHKVMMKNSEQSKSPAQEPSRSACLSGVLKVLCVVFMGLASVDGARAALIEFNNTGGTTATNGLRFYIEDTTKIQVRRLNNTGQVYSPTAIPPSNSLDNGVFIRANGLVYGPSHTVSAFNPNGGMYNTFSIGAASPANPSAPGVQQTATGNFGITTGPQVSVVWKYTTPLDFLTAEVTLTIPTGYAVSAVNPVRYYHVFDTYLGGSDNGCGFSMTDSNGKFVIGTYPPASGTTCPSSTSIPSGVSVVESFRERSGLNFSRYCAAGWASFFTSTTGAPNCSVLQAAVMSNTVVTTYQDTGIGIEFDFAASGTYTFSYDFVIGSPSVPPYDHMEIRHDGASTLCPDNVTVLACTSSTVPCPVGNIVNTGTLTGAVTTTPLTPAVTKTPATFSVGSTGSTATVALQGASPGGSYTLGTSGLSTVPLNGTKCWNTVTLSQSCAFTVTNTPCVSGFECLETSLTYNNLTSTPAARNPLYTKLAGSNFRFDVVALQSGGVVASSYTAASNVTVELFDDSIPPASCSAYASPVASQSITFVAGDAGRKTLATDFNVANAYSKLRCRVRDANLTPTVFGCSSDQFSVRPAAAALTTSATAAGPSASATPTIKAGANFTLGAATSPGSGYSGTLILDTSKLTAQTPTQDASTQTGGVVGTLTPSSLTANAAAVNASYSEVGYLYLAPGAYRDDAFTAVDSATGDCITSTASDGNLADTLSGGKYGCSIGNKTAVSLGRFIPDHFLVTPGSLVNRRLAACLAPSSFTYAGEEMQLKDFLLTARNALTTPTATRNYAGVFARLDGSVIANFGIGAVDLADLTPPVLATAFVNGTGPGELALVSSVGSWGALSGVGTFSANLRLNRAAAPVGPYESFRLGLAPVDADGVAVRAADRNLDLTAPADLVNDKVLVGSSLVRFGRLRLANALGPHTRDLKMAMEAQFWNGTNFARNSDDSCTVVPASAWSFGNYVRRPASVVFNPAVAADRTLASGAAFVMIPRPTGGRVTFDASINLATTGAETAASSCLKDLSLGTPTRPWAPVITNAAPSPVRPSLTHLMGQWCDASYTNNPSARGSLGLYRGADSLIFQRENY